MVWWSNTWEEETFPRLESLAWLEVSNILPNVSIKHFRIHVFLSWFIIHSSFFLALQTQWVKNLLTLIFHSGFTGMGVGSNGHAEGWGITDINARMSRTRCRGQFFFLLWPHTLCPLLERKWSGVFWTLGVLPWILLQLCSVWREWKIFVKCRKFVFTKYSGICVNGFSVMMIWFCWQKMECHGRKSLKTFNKV